jgi:predicted nuclease of predicted toxin-antitoxin system
MRILLDESVPTRLGRLLIGHEVTSVQRQGWGGIKNGKLLALAATEFDVLLTADKGIEYQQNLATLPVAVLIVLATSNRLEDMALVVPNILKALSDLQPRAVQRVAS